MFKVKRKKKIPLCIIKQVKYIEENVRVLSSYDYSRIDPKKETFLYLLFLCLLWDLCKNYLKVEELLSFWLISLQLILLSLHIFDI